MRNNASHVRRLPLLALVHRPLVAYFALAYGIIRLFSAMATPGLLPVELPAVARGLGAVLWHFGPALAAMLVAGTNSGRVGLGELLGRPCVWRVAAGWYPFVLLFPFAARLMAVGLDVLLGGTPPVLFSARDAPGGNPLALFVPVFAGVLLQAGLAEEIGWRGFALPRLQTRHNAPASSLILGVLWAGWHFHPLLWPAMRPVAPWYVVGTLPFTILFTWVYISAGVSLLLPVLFHTASNVNDWIVPLVPFLTGTGSGPAYGLLVLVNTTLAAAVVIACEPQRLARSTVARQKER